MTSTILHMTRLVAGMVAARSRRIIPSSSTRRWRIAAISILRIPWVAYYAEEACPFCSQRLGEIKEIFAGICQHELVYNMALATDHVRLKHIASSSGHCLRINKCISGGILKKGSNVMTEYIMRQAENSID